MTRTITAPGIQLNEYDRSNQSNTVDQSTVGTVTTVFGFADKGDDYDIKWINSMDTFENTYGYPKNDAETYFYNAAYEVINRGGLLTTAKLPYKNNSLQHFSYTAYKVSDQLTELSSPYDIVKYHIVTSKNSNIGEKSLFDFFMMPDIQTLMEYYIMNEREESSSLTIDEGIAEDTTPIKAEYKMWSDQGIIEIFNEEGLYLDSIRDMFEYIKDKVNFTYNSLDAYEDIFYTNDHIRNEAVYMLFAIMHLGENDDYETYLEGIYPGIMDKYEDVLDEIKTTLENDFVINKRTDFEDILTEFGQKQTLQTYKSYYTTIREAVNHFSQVNFDIMEDVLKDFEEDHKTDALDSKFTEIRVADYSVKYALEIKNDDITNTGLISYEMVDKMKVGEILPPNNQIIITDITRSRYTKDDKDNEIIGILPVITTPANALYYQELIPHTDDNLSDFVVINGIRNTNSTQASVLSCINNDTSLDTFVGLSQPLGNEEDITESDITLSKTACDYFPKFKTIDNRIQIDYLKYIGVVVFKMYKNVANDNKIAFTPVESFVGSLKRDDIDINTKKSTFIDNIVNNSSNYINLFSNVKFARPYEKAKIPDQAQTYYIKSQIGTSLGFYACDTLKNIEVKTSIIDALKNIFSKIEDRNLLDIDIICDAGVSNIAQFIASTCIRKIDSDGYQKNQMLRCGEFDLGSENAYMFNLNSEDSANVWKTVLNVFDNFVKTTRKDCMFIADGLRPVCLSGNEKVVRNTNISNTVKSYVLPKLKYIQNAVNSSYSAGYLNWFQQINHFSEELFWCPPSIKATGVYLYTDTYSQFWSAPAGLNRGMMLDDVVDIAFNPTNEEAGYIYNSNWNYAISYPTRGIVIEGQKTFQRDKTAFDRINVRRLFLGLEKKVREIARYFTYEGITDYLMMRFRDSITPIFEDAKEKGGLKDYVIVCDSRNNNEQTIDNNELHCTIAVKPVKSLEFIVLNFIATSQGADVNEVATESL